MDINGLLKISSNRIPFEIIRNLRRYKIGISSLERESPIDKYHARSRKFLGFPYVILSAQNDAVNTRARSLFSAPIVLRTQWKKFLNLFATKGVTPVCSAFVNIMCETLDLCLALPTNQNRVITKTALQDIVCLCVFFSLTLLHLRNWSDVEHFEADSVSSK